MKKFTKVFNWGGVLILSAFLSLSLIFASCDNPSDTNPANNSGNNTSLGNNNNNDSNDNNGTNDDPSNSGNNNKNPNLENPEENPGTDNPSTVLPESVGENPIKKTIKLNRDGYTSDECYLELKADGTARYIRIHSGEEEIEAQFTYTYDANKKEIYMKYENMYNAQTTFAYEIEDGEITLTEKFTGVKNLCIESGCHLHIRDSFYGGIYNDLAY